MNSIVQRPSPNFEARRDGKKPNTLLLHYTGMQSAEAALQRLCDPASKVSSHYVVDEDGAIAQLVDEAQRAFHAGESFWGGERDINSVSIGIEIVNPGHEFGYRNFPGAQMQSVLKLCRDIVQRHRIAPRNVLGHSDVAPTRKIDPGELFDWKFLADNGVGLYPRDANTAPTTGFTAKLAEYGYDIRDERAAILAFQRHFTPRNMTGVADEASAGVLQDLFRQLSS